MARQPPDNPAAGHGGLAPRLTIGYRWPGVPEPGRQAPIVFMPISQFKDVIPILDVRDVEKALRYYVERLGFQIEFRYAGDPNNYAGVGRDGVCLHMQWQHEDHFKAGTAGRVRVRVIVDDPDALFEEYRGKGVFDERTQVRDTAWGTREFGFRDLDGNGLTFYRDL